jgi:hypothetical protein
MTDPRTSRPVTRPRRPQSGSASRGGFVGLAGSAALLAVLAAPAGPVSAAVAAQVVVSAPSVTALAAPAGAGLPRGFSVPLSQSFLAAADKSRLKGDDGRRSFGVQPSGPRKPDPRPNLTYRDVRPGQRLFDHVAIINVGARPATLSVYAADALNTPEGAFDVLPAGRRSRDLGSWVRLRRSTVTVPARSAFITPIELRVPKDAEPGDHAAAIIASLRTVGRDAKGNVVNRDDRVGTRMYVRVKGALRPRIELERKDVSFSDGLPFRGRTDVTYTIRNTGNVRLEGTQSIRVSGLFGLSSQAVDVPDMPELLPGNEIDVSWPVDDVVPTFLNTAHVTVDPVSVTGNVDPALAQVSGEMPFTAVSWPAVGASALVAAGGLLVLVRRRRRRRPADLPPGRDGGSAVGWADGPGDGPPAMSRRPTGVARPVRLLVVAALGAAAVVAPATTAGAVDGTLTFVPGKGTVGTPIYAVTSAPCPTQATNVLGTLYGKGMPAQGKVVVPNQDAPVRHDGSFGVGLQDNLRNFAREEGIKELDGPYRLELACIDQFGTKTFATFSGAITFDQPTAFTAPVPTKPPVDGVPTGYLALVFPAYQRAVEAEAEARTAELAASAPVTPDAAASAPAAAPATLAVAPGAASTVTRPGPALGIGVSLILVVAGGLAAAVWLWTRSGAGPATPQGRARTPVTWPDDRDRHPPSRHDRSR